ncbi:alpha/beta hydrolase [Phytoactinopolyspora limicola]|uniref:alpha/beta hydrolase n=1 Tax=Phytoactinopolyspora limicola TaxID=2715536 RepID=UPI001407B1D6|nr:alpha/beta hydrolase [Phytoactinopolyspora limicola]
MANEEPTTTWGIMSPACHSHLRHLKDTELQLRIAELTASPILDRPIEDTRAKASECFAHFGTDLGLGAINDDVVIREVNQFTMTADVVQPRGPGPHPVLIYIHGGAFITGRARDYRNVAMRFAEAGILVFNINYRLAPEHPFPAAYDDCIAAVRWVSEVAGQYGGDPSFLTIGGDSAGANLSASVAVNLANEREAPEIAATVLLYGIYDNARMMRDTKNKRDWQQVLAYYLGPNFDDFIDDTRVSPIHLARNLPPAYIAVGSDDTLCLQQSKDLLSILEALRTPHLYTMLEGLPHGFASLEALYPEIRDTFWDAAAFLHSLHRNLNHPDTTQTRHQWVPNGALRARSETSEHAQPRTSSTDSASQRVATSSSSTTSEAISFTSSLPNNPPG